MKRIVFSTIPLLSFKRYEIFIKKTRFLSIENNIEIHSFTVDDDVVRTRVEKNNENTRISIISNINGPTATINVAKLLKSIERLGKIQAIPRVYYKDNNVKVSSWRVKDDYGKIGIDVKTIAEDKVEIDEEKIVSKMEGIEKVKEIDANIDVLVIYSNNEKMAPFSVEIRTSYSERKGKVTITDIFDIYDNIMILLPKEGIPSNVEMTIEFQIPYGFDYKFIVKTLSRAINKAIDIATEIIDILATLVALT